MATIGERAQQIGQSQPEQGPVTIGQRAQQIGGKPLGTQGAGTNIIDPQRIAASAQNALSRLSGAAGQLGMQEGTPENPALATEASTGVVEREAELGLRRFINNVLAAPSAAGETLAMTAALPQTVAQSFGENEQGFGQRLMQNVEQQRGQFPANALIATPRPTVEGISAGFQAPFRAAGNVVQGEAPNISGEFQEARLGEQARVQRLEEESGFPAGELTADAATLLGMRAPFARARLPRDRAGREAAEAQFLQKPIEMDIPLDVRRKWRDVFTDDMIPAFLSGGQSVGRGSVRSVEAGLETAMLAAMNDEDPLTSAMLGAGAQSIGSAGLFLGERLWDKPLVTTVATAATIGMLWQGLTPMDDDNVFEAIDFARNKTVAAGALGLLGAMAGAGRLRGPNAEKIFMNMPVFMDAATSIPRGVVQNRLRELVEQEKAGNDAPLRTLNMLSSNPTAFNEDQLRALDRALKKDKAGAFSREVNRLLEQSESFRETLNNVEQKQQEVR